MNNKRYSPEFKDEAVRQILDQGYSVAEASRSLDIGETTLRRWLHQLEGDRAVTGARQTAKALMSKQRRVQYLERQVRWLEQEKSNKMGYRSFDVRRDESYLLIDQ